MSKKDSKENRGAQGENNSGKAGEELTLKSLLVQAKGIEPLIIGVFIIIIYWFMSGIAFFLSWKFGRL